MAVGTCRKPQPTERSIRAMRVEATIAGEAINAWRFAKARRIISFGEDESTKWGKAIITTNTGRRPRSSSIMAIMPIEVGNRTLLLRLPH